MAMNHMLALSHWICLEFNSWSMRD